PAPRELFLFVPAPLHARRATARFDELLRRPADGLQPESGRRPGRRLASVVVPARPRLHIANLRDRLAVAGALLGPDAIDTAAALAPLGGGTRLLFRRRPAQV